MAYYSFVVVAKHPVGIPSPLVLLDTGRNVFSAEVSDIEAFKETLADANVSLKELHRLDAHEPGSFTDLLLEGETDLLVGDVSV